jgi:hypothetical protein
VSPAPGVLELYATGSDGQVRQRLFNDAGWSDWSSVGSGITSGPAAVMSGASTLDVLARGSTNSLLWRRRTNGSWSAWSDLGGGLLSAPSAAVRRGAGVVDVAVRGTDNAVWFTYWSPSAGWAGYSSLGGGTLSAPSVVSYRAGYVHVFARSGSNTVDTIWWDGSAWSAWATIGGEATSGPAAVSDADNRIDVFVRGADAAIHRRRWDGTAWLPWERIDPTPVSSGPAAVALGPDHIAVFARMGGEIRMNVLDGTTWSGWSLVETTPPPTSPPPPPPPTTCGHSVAHMKNALRGKRRRTLRYGGRVTLTGQALGPDRAPVPGAIVHVLDIRAGAELGQVAAGPDGKFRLKVRPGVSRTIRTGFQWGGESFFACGMSLSLKVRAGVRLIAPRRVRSRGLIRLSGHLLGGHIPLRGKLVELQGWSRGEWRLFRSVRSTRTGRFHASYRVRTAIRGSLRIRARARRERGYPYTLGYSRVVRVRIG